MHKQTQNTILKILQEKLNSQEIEVIDNGHKHKGHKSAIENPDKGHFHVKIKAQSLSGLSKIQQHRKVYTYLEEIMHKIHALEISCQDS